MALTTNLHFAYNLYKSVCSQIRIYFCILMHASSTWLLSLAVTGVMLIGWCSHVIQVHVIWVPKEIRKSMEGLWNQLLQIETSHLLFLNCNLYFIASSLMKIQNTSTTLGAREWFKPASHYFVMLSRYIIYVLWTLHIWALTWNFQQCGMCDKQSLKSECAYAQSDQSLCQ